MWIMRVFILYNLMDKNRNKKEGLYLIEKFYDTNK